MIKTPIIVSENGDLSAFRSLEDAESDLEAIDVLNGEYEAYDSQGRRLQLSVEKKDCPGVFGIGHASVDVVKIFESQDPDIAEGQRSLAEAIRTFLTSIHSEHANIDDLSLDELVSLLVEKLDPSRN